MKLKLFLKYLVFIGIFVHNIVYAQNNFIDILDTFDGKFFGAAKGWQREAELLARNIFFSLILIDFIIIGINYLLDKNKIKTIFNEIIYKLIFSCGFLYIFQLISNFNNTGSTFLSWFGIAGGRISRITQIDITSIFETGISIIVTILHKFPKGVFESYFFCIIISGSIFIILFCFFILGFELLATKIEAYILMFGGSILLAFAGSKFTKQYAE